MVMASFLIVVILTVIAWGIYRTVLYRKNKEINILRECLLLIFLIYFLILLFMTVFKSGTISFNNPFDSYMYKSEGIFGIINIIPFKETINTILDEHVPITMPIRNIVGNILLFVPLGIMIPILFNKYDKLSKIFVLGLTSSLCIEVVQLFVGYNISDIDDVIFNTTGAILGFACYKLLKVFISKTNVVKILEKVSDYETENIFKKSIKVVSMISALIVCVYTYSVFEQTASDKLPDEELIQEIFKQFDGGLDGEVVHVEDLEDKKLYLIKKEDGLQVLQLVKHGKSRYANSYEGIGDLVEGSGYSVGILNKLNESIGELKVNVVVYGKNTNADELIVGLNNEEHKIQLEKDAYFMAVYPEYVEIEDKVLDEMYNGKNGNDFYIKFLDSNGEVVEDIKCVNQDL